MKGIVVYDTSYGNTKAVAGAISEGLKESGIEAPAVYVKDAGKLNAADYDFLVLGSPTRFGTMSFTVKGFIGKLNKEWTGVPFAAFDTENPGNEHCKDGSAGEKIAGKLREKGMVQLAPVLKAIVLQIKDSIKCTLQEGEIERAGDYGRELAAAVAPERVPVSV